MTPDEQKALDHLAQEDRREAYQRFLQSRLKATDQTRAQQTRKFWAPLTLTGRIKGQVDG